MKLDKTRHPWVRRIAFIASVFGWFARRRAARSHSIRLRQGETLLVSVVTDKDRPS